MVDKRTSGFSTGGERVRGKDERKKTFTPYPFPFTPVLSLFSANHAAQLGSQALDLGELLRDALEERALRLDALIYEEGRGLGAAAGDSGLHELFEPLLRVVRELDGDDIIVLRRERALDRAADVATDGGERFGDGRGDVAHRRRDALAARRRLVLGQHQVVNGFDDFGVNGVVRGAHLR